MLELEIQFSSNTENPRPASTLSNTFWIVFTYIVSEGENPCRSQNCMMLLYAPLDTCLLYTSTFDTRFNVVVDSGDSLLALIGSLIAPVFKPLGFSDWRISTALITGFTAKESVVSTLTVLLGDSTTV